MFNLFISLFFWLVKNWWVWISGLLLIHWFGAL